MTFALPLGCKLLMGIIAAVITILYHNFGIFTSNKIMSLITKDTHINEIKKFMRHQVTTLNHASVNKDITTLSVA